MVNFKDFWRVSALCAFIGLTWCRCGSRRAEICITYATSPWSQAEDTHVLLGQGCFAMLGFPTWLRQEAYTTRLNISPSLRSCRLAAWMPGMRVPSGAWETCICVSASVHCADLGIPESLCSVTDLASVDCQGEPGLTTSCPRGELSPKSWYTQYNISIV